MGIYLLIYLFSTGLFFKNRIIIVECLENISCADPQTPCDFTLSDFCPLSSQLHVLQVDYLMFFTQVNWSQFP